MEIRKACILKFEAKKGKNSRNNRLAQNIFELLYNIQIPWKKTSMEVDLHDFFF